MRLRLVCCVALLAGLCWVGPAGAAPTFSFQRLTLTLPPSFGDPWNLRVADLDGANGPDIVVMSRSGDGATRPDIGIFLNNGDNTFQPPTFVSPGCRENYSFAIGQFSTGDASPDLLVACSPLDSGLWRRLRGNGDGSFQFDPTRDQLLLNSDVTDDYGALSLASFGTGGGGESLVYTHWYYSGAGGAGLFCLFPVAQLVADLDSGENYKPTCGGAIQSNYAFAAPPFQWPDNAAYGQVQDVERRVHLVAVVYGGALGGWRELWFARPRLWPSTLSPEGGVSSTGRFVNGLDSAQLVTVSHRQSLLAVYDPAAATEIAPDYWQLPAPRIVRTGAPYPFGPYPEVTAAADFNRDGNLDLAVLAHAYLYGPGDQSLVEVHAGHGDGTFERYEAFPTRAGWGGFEPLVISDLNGDGYPDLVNLDTYAPAGEPRYVTVLLNTMGHPHRNGAVIRTRGS